jgi:hypothetical protein
MISGIHFSELCSCVIDPRYPTRHVFTYGNAQNGAWVFVNGDYIHDLLKRMPLLHTKRFVFVIHNTDRSFGPNELRALLPYSIHIFAINTTVQHNNLTTIPIGFVDRQIPFLKGFQRQDATRDIEVYANFTTVTNSAKRQECIDVFKSDPKALFRTGLSVAEYLDDLSRSKFVLCPEGTGLDTHRVYESLLCGATPVVLRNSLSTLYQKLPICIVEKWSDPFYIPVNKHFSMECSTYLTLK